eukprot:200711-Hanusia_phi.AAC.1
MSTSHGHLSPQRGAAAVKTRRYPPLPDKQQQQQQQQPEGTQRCTGEHSMPSEREGQEEVARSLRRAYGIGIAEEAIAYISTLDSRCGKSKVRCRHAGSLLTACRRTSRHCQERMARMCTSSGKCWGRMWMRLQDRY